jgi:hypothetical protein
MLLLPHSVLSDIASTPALFSLSEQNERDITTNDSDRCNLGYSSFHTVVIVTMNSKNISRPLL